MAPRLSVLLPCYNHGAFIDDALASLSAQTWQDFEVVIVDDGSTDPATIEKLGRLSSGRTRVLRTANRGLAAARNHAAAHAAGELFCSLDADDRLAPRWFERAVATLDARPAVAFVSHWLETFGDEQWTWTPERCDLPALLARNTVNGAAVVRRVAFEAVGGYDERMRAGCEDWDFWLRIVESGGEGVIIPEVLFYYRRRPDSMSRAMLEEAAYRPPLERLIGKHETAYRQYLIDVLMAQEAEALHLVDEIGRLERGHLAELEPALRRAREEYAAVTAKAARVEAVQAREAELERLQWKAAELEREVAALRTSWSWRVTAPLRKIYGRLRGEP